MGSCHVLQVFTELTSSLEAPATANSYELFHAFGLHLVSFCFSEKLCSGWACSGLVSGADGSCSADQDCPQPEAVGCEDSHSWCEYWAEHDECNKSPDYMKVNCRKACQECDKTPAPGRCCSAWGWCTDQCGDKPDQTLWKGIFFLRRRHNLGL